MNSESFCGLCLPGCEEGGVLLHCGRLGFALSEQ